MRTPTKPSQANRQQQQLQLDALAERLSETWDVIDDLLAEPHRDPRPALQDLVAEIAETLADVVAVKPTEILTFPGMESRS